MENLRIKDLFTFACLFPIVYNYFHKNSFIIIKKYNNKEKTSKQTTWQEQVEHAMNNVSTRSTQNDISLIDYTYKGKIDSQKQISDLLAQLFSDDTYVVTYLDNINYDIVPLRTIKQQAQAKGINAPNEFLKNQLDSIIKIGMEIIDLEWSYKGKTIHSTAIASNEQGGILYDHIGNMITIPNTKSSNNDELMLHAKLTKTRSENVNSFRDIVTDINDQGERNLWGKII